MKFPIQHTGFFSNSLFWKTFAVSFFLWFSMSSCATKSALLDHFQISHTKPLNKTQTLSSCTTFQSIELQQTSKTEVLFRSSSFENSNQESIIPFGENFVQNFRLEQPTSNSPPKFILYQNIKVFDC